VGRSLALPPGILYDATGSVRRASIPGGEHMSWEAPDFVELNMSAEINSYQDDFDREQDEF
jgi:coenzyme PQQ precursor peptide PqqA